LSNNGFLINSSTPTSDPAALERSRMRPGHVHGEVAMSSNRLLIPWFLCFRRADLLPVPNEQGALQLPCTTVEQATRNLEASLPVFEAIAGDATLARPYWQLACALVRRLPLPHVVLQVGEILDMGTHTPESFTRILVGALSGDLDAVPHLKALAEYQEDVAPYPLDVLYSVPGVERHSPRTWNASVLDGGFQPDFRFVHWAHAPGTQVPEAPPPVPPATFGDLYVVPGLLRQWALAEAPASPGAEMRLHPGTPEQLRIEIYARNDEDARRLAGSATLAARIEALAQRVLLPWCRTYGFEWHGCRVTVPDWARKP
jgi:hypothetical protein